MATATPLVSVITPTYNRADLLPETLDSLLAQEYPRLELIVLDDGSTDDTPAVLDRYGDRIRRVRHDNMGQSRTVNRGFELATGELLCVINSDDPQPPGLFGPLVAELEAHPEAVLVYPDWTMVDRAGKSMGTVRTVQCSPVDFVRWFICIPGPGTVFRRHLFERIGGWDPTYRFGNDWEWFLRASLVGPFRRVPRLLAHWRHHPGSATAGRRGLEMAREMVTIAERFFTRADLPPEVRAVRTEAFRNAYFTAGMLVDDFPELQTRFEVRDRVYPRFEEDVPRRPESKEPAAVIRWLHQEVGVRDREAVRLHDEVARLHREVASRDGEVARLHREVASRDGEVTRLHREVASRDGEVRRLRSGMGAPPEGGRPERTPPPLDPVRASWYRMIFVLAGIYNLAFGAWAGIWPTAFFTLTLQPVPSYPSLFGCIGMIVGVYGLLYLHAARRLDEAWPILAIGLLGKVLGPFGLAYGIHQGEWSIRAILMCTFNDVLWWVPFGLFLLEGTPVARFVLRRGPELCGAVNALAALLLGLFLAGGTELEPDLGARARFLAEHVVLWRVTWGLWMLAAVGLLGLLAWWGARVPRPRLAKAAFLVGAAGALVDLFMDALYLGWYPEHLAAIAPWATVVSATVANGLYTLACIAMTLATPGLPGWVRGLAWTAWAGGAALAVAGLVGTPQLLVGATALMMGGFVPFCFALPRVLP